MNDLQEMNTAPLSTATQKIRVVIVDDHELLRMALRDLLNNEADFEVPYVWGHHPAFGPPLTASGPNSYSSTSL